MEVIIVQGKNNKQKLTHRTEMSGRREASGVVWLEVLNGIDAPDLPP